MTEPFYTPLSHDSVPLSFPLIVYSFSLTASHHPSLSQAIRVLGLLGALDPYKHKISLGQIDIQGDAGAILSMSESKSGQDSELGGMCPSFYLKFCRLILIFYLNFSIIYYNYTIQGPVILLEWCYRKQLLLRQDLDIRVILIINQSFVNLNFYVSLHDNALFNKFN